MHASVPPFQGVCGMGAELEVVVSLDAERPSHCPHRWLGPWPLAVPTRASPQCLTRTHAPQSGCMAVLGYRCTAFNWGAISRPQASYTGLHPTDARSKSEYSLTHSLTHSLGVSTQNPHPFYVLFKDPARPARSRLSVPVNGQISRPRPHPFII